MPILRDPQVNWQSTAISYLYDQYASIRTENYRYIRYKQGQQEFYDLARDPHEWKNQANNPEFAKIIGKLNSQLPAVEEMAKQLVREGRKPKK